ncbi:ATP/GTP-binding protein [uncultured Bacteroides sp.]|uniref:AAA family ATPase n=2 Tax=uncultured Bacteroides sp. TaxID=162156 RepID=UPI0025FE968F|nr:ATP-binding protein [uncultured Bacteroides sp.]
MLYRYTVSNFMTYKETVELSMIPSVNNIEGHLIDKDFFPVLKTAIIYGANASGKSSLIKSMDFARSYILDNSTLSPLLNYSYRLDKEKQNQESVFSFEIKTGREIYQYGFSVIFNKAMVQEEWLYELTKEICIFHRERTEDGISLKEHLKNMSAEELSRLRIYEEDQASSDHSLLITKLGSISYGKGMFWDSCKEVFTWFKRLTIFFPNTKFNLLSAVYGNEKEVNILYKEYFKIFGIDIDNIHLKEVPIEYLTVNPEFLSEINKSLLDKKNEGTKGMLNINGKEYLFEINDEDRLTAKEVKFRHRVNDYTAEFSKDEESDGTQRLFDLIPPYARVILSGGVLIVDEIDRNLHSLLTTMIFRNFLSSEGEQNRQLICTTHDVKMINLSLLRPDEIWFINRNRNEASSLYPLAKYRVEYPDNAEINYLNGMYQGIPDFNFNE